MILNFKNYINESLKDQFDSIEVGDTVQVNGSTNEVTEVDGAIIKITNKKGQTIKYNFNQFKLGDGKVIKNKKQDNE